MPPERKEKEVESPHKNGCMTDIRGYDKSCSKCSESMSIRRNITSHDPGMYRWNPMKDGI